MLARILGVLLIIGGVAWGIELIWPLFGGLFGLLGAVAVGLLAAGALYIGLRWRRGAVSWWVVMSSLRGLAL